jgi:uncharacterized protein (DUF2235 family)
MKRLITCTDGTWNRPGITDRGQLVRSNVELIYNCIRDGKCHDGTVQLKIYHDGIGSSTFDKKDQVFGGISGLGIDKNIKDVYKFLMLNFNIGDEIYLFGFSRGAYTARSLAGFIRNCGILKPVNMHLVDEAYELYRDRNDYTGPDSDMMKSFRHNFSFEMITPIKFIGVWDTVGSLGLPLRSKQNYNLERYKFHDVKISSYVNYAYHALAIDEQRKLFEPTLWELSDTVKNNPGHPQVMEQRWFSGVHCNIGGGYVDCGLSDIALMWLIEKAKGAGLTFDLETLAQLNPKHELKPNPSGELRNSRTIEYWFWRKVWRNVLKGKHTNEQIDDSVKSRCKSNPGYKPLNIQDWLGK